MAEAGTLIPILLVEDNLDDITITKKALKEARLVNKLYVVRDGQEALDYLKRWGPYADPASSPRPGLILLDINLPKLTGVEVLEQIKDDPDLRRIPVVMLTVSKRDEDIANSYEKGCNSFIQKPVEFERFVEEVKQVGLYWGMLNIAPLDGG